jgi:hypothetical protein
MRNIIYSIITVIVLGFYSCSPNESLEYDINQKDEVYFDFYDDSDSLFYDFGFSDIENRTFTIPIGILGQPKDYDREFKISTEKNQYEANEEDPSVVPATKEYFSLPEKFIIPKNAVKSTISVKLLRHADLLTKRAILNLTLISSDDFVVGEKKQFTIAFDDKTPVAPYWWKNHYFGEFTKFKARLFMKYFKEMENENKAVYLAIVDKWGENLDKTTVSFWSSYRISFAKYVHLKMYNYSQAHPELDLKIVAPIF